MASPSLTHLPSAERIDALLAIYESPLLDLVYRAATVHRAHHDPHDVQRAALLSIKTGGCPENCGYCPQSARHNTDVEPQRLLSVDAVLQAASEAKAGGATRFCMGAAWRNVRDGAEFDSVLEMVRGVRDLGMEACATLGMLTPDQARRLGEAGLTAYNHNLTAGLIFTPKSFRHGAMKIAWRRSTRSMPRASVCAAAGFWGWVNRGATVLPCWLCLPRAIRNRPACRLMRSLPFRERLWEIVSE